MTKAYRHKTFLYRWVFSLILGVILSLSATFFASGALNAHILPQERRVIVQVSSDRVEIVVEHLEPPNERLSLLMRRFDIDGDGELNEAEGKLAGKLWVKHILYGL